jgi:hypothetical protein
VSLRFALDGALFARFRWVTSLGAAAYLLVRGNPAIGLVAGLWPLIVLVLVLAHPPSKTLRLQALFAEKVREIL